MKAISLWDDISENSIKMSDSKKVKIECNKENSTEKSVDNSRYMIKAFVNKYNRQMYLSGYEDCSDWCISAVPHPTTYEKCETLIKRAVKKFHTFPTIFGKSATIPDFTIVEWSDN